MEKVSVCRVCLHADVHRTINDTPLEEVYENLTGMPFQTKDMKPMSVCYICYAQLLRTHKFKLKCMRADGILEIMMDQLVNTKEQNKSFAIDRLSLSAALSVSPVETVSIIGDIYIKSEVEDKEIKQEEAVEPDFDMEVASAQASPVASHSELDTQIEKSELANCDKYPKWINIIADIESTEATLAELCDGKNIPTVDIIKEEYDSDDTKDNNYTVNNNSKTNTEVKKSVNYNAKEHTKMGDNNEIVTKNTKSKYHECEICGKKFTQKCHVSRHAWIHTDRSKRFNCDICNKAFTRKGTLESHMRYHEGDKPYTCNVCNKSFVKKSNFENHNLIHTGEKPFVCDWCDRRFNRKGNLECHIRTHTGDKPHVCSVCQKGFSNKSILRCHMRIHDNEKPFRCKDCGKGFDRKSYLENHVRIHLRSSKYQS